MPEPYGGFKFQNQGFQFYKHPPAEAYGLNKLLFEVRHSADLRARILTNLDAVAAEYELQPAQRKAAEELINVGKGGLVSEHVRPLVEAGRASVTGADVAACHFFDESPAGTATGGRGTDEELILGTGSRPRRTQMIRPSACELSAR